MESMPDSASFRESILSMRYWQVSWLSRSRSPSHPSIDEQWLLMNRTDPEVNILQDGITVARQPVICTRFLINSPLRETSNGVDDVSNNERLGTKI